MAADIMLIGYPPNESIINPRYHTIIGYSDHYILYRTVDGGLSHRNQMNIPPTWQTTPCNQ